MTTVIRAMGERISIAPVQPKIIQSSGTTALYILATIASALGSLWGWGVDYLVGL